MNTDDIEMLPDQKDPKKECEFVPEGIIINEVQLLLAEKRTSLSTMRTGITVFVLPLSVLSVLIATSKYYDVFKVMHFLVPLLVINAALVFLVFVSVAIELLVLTGQSINCYAKSMTLILILNWLNWKRESWRKQMIYKLDLWASEEN